MFLYSLWITLLNLFTCIYIPVSKHVYNVNTYIKRISYFDTFVWLYRKGLNPLSQPNKKRMDGVYKSLHLILIFKTFPFLDVWNMLPFFGFIVSLFKKNRLFYRLCLFDQHEILRFKSKLIFVFKTISIHLWGPVKQK